MIFLFGETVISIIWKKSDLQCGMWLISADFRRQVLGLVSVPLAVNLSMEITKVFRLFFTPSLK